MEDGSKDACAIVCQQASLLSPLLSTHITMAVTGSQEHAPAACNASTVVLSYNHIEF